MERLTVHLSTKLLARSRRLAAEEGRTLTSLIEVGLRRVLDTPSALEKRHRIEVRVSSATGGLLPGFDATKLASQVQELDDMEYVERMKHFK